MASLLEKIGIMKSHERLDWKTLLTRHAPVLLPAACDGLTARLIEQAGFKAYQIGGFAMIGMRYGFPDIDLVHYGEHQEAMIDIVEASSLPVLIDADDGYGDVKNVTRTIQGFESLGASAIFFEDQKAPKRCGHMDNKEVIPAEHMVSKVKAAIAARRNPETFIIARTDARAAVSMKEALHRGEAYLKAGADGLFIEGPQSVKELEQIGKHFKGTPMIANMFEGGGKTPVLKPSELHEMGFSMITYPTTLLFQITKAIQRALNNMLAEKPMPKEDSVDMKEFEKIVDMDRWAILEKRFGKGSD